MKLIHCADLHLDSRMESGLPPEKARERRMELLHTFTKMVDMAAEDGVEDVPPVLQAVSISAAARISAKIVVSFFIFLSPFQI